KVNKKSILIELHNLSNEINFKELENLLHNSIVYLNNLNKRELGQSEKTKYKETGKNQGSNNILNTRISRAFWIEGLRIGECKDSFIGFYPSKYTICKK
ncbi:MAG: hypothetical protein ACFE96_06005, partial [Candidatus Hermodarchaeota archaeon]